MERGVVAAVLHLGTFRTSYVFTIAGAKQCTFGVSDAPDDVSPGDVFEVRKNKYRERGIF